MIPVIANSVENVPNIPYLVSYRGANSAIYLGNNKVNIPTRIP